MQSIKTTLYWLATLETGRAAWSVFAAGREATAKYGGAPIHALLWLVLLVTCVVFAIAAVTGPANAICDRWRKKRKFVQIL